MTPWWSWPYCSFEHSLCRDMPSASLEPLSVHRPACVYCRCIVASASPFLEPPVWKTTSKLHQERFAMSTEGLLFGQCFHRNSALVHRHRGKQLFSFLTPFFLSASHFSPKANFCILFLCTALPASSSLAEDQCTNAQHVRAERSFLGIKLLLSFLFFSLST